MTNKYPKYVLICDHWRRFIISAKLPYDDRGKNEYHNNIKYRFRGHGTALGPTIYSFFFL